MPQTRSPRNRPSGARLAGLVSLVVAVLAGCDMPNFEGPQIQSPPRGFLLVRSSPLQRRMFQDQEVVFETTWVESIADFSTIHVNGHLGVLDLEDVMAAQEVAKRFADDPDLVFGEVEPLEVDGRDAWGWAERVETPTRGLVSVAYRAAVPYDTITYAIEFYSGEPGLKRAAPDTLKAIISTFAIGETTINWPLVALLVGALLFVASGLRSRARAKATRLQSIKLVKVKKPAEEEAVHGEPVGAGAAAAAGGVPASGARAPGAGADNPPR